MCFYNSFSARALALAKRYGRKTDIIEEMYELLDDQYKITAFTHSDCSIISFDQSIDVAKWGLIPHWTKTPEEAAKIRKMTINARSESAFNLPSFRSAIFSKRCLIPSTGYFEFHHSGKEVIPYFIFLKNEEIFSLGALYEIWLNPSTNEQVKTFSVLTVPANELCAKIHNGGKNPFRMPLIIGREQEEHWLDGSLNVNDIKSFFLPFETAAMDAYPITRDFIKRSSKDSSITSSQLNPARGLPITRMFNNSSNRACSVLQSSVSCFYCDCL